MEYSNETIEEMAVAAEEWDPEISPCKSNWAQVRNGKTKG